MHLAFPAARMIAIGRSPLSRGSNFFLEERKLEAVWSRFFFFSDSEFEIPNRVRREKAPGIKLAGNRNGLVRLELAGR